VLEIDEQDLHFADDGIREDVGAMREVFHLGCEGVDWV